MSMAYRGRADGASLDRLGRALTGSARSSTMVEVDVTPEQIDVLRLVASGTRAPGIVEVAQIVGAELDRLPPPERRRRGPRRPDPAEPASKRKRRCTCCRRSRSVDHCVGPKGTTCLICRQTGAARVPLAREIQGGSPGLGRAK